MAGRKRRAFLPEPDEMRRSYGENAVAAASIYGSIRPVTYRITAFMGLMIVVIVVLGAKHESGFPGWGVALIGIDIAVTCVLLTVVIMKKGKRMASLRIGHL
jgi:hypothetical protein